MIKLIRAHPKPDIYDLKYCLKNSGIYKIDRKDWKGYLLAFVQGVCFIFDEPTGAFNSIYYDRSCDEILKDNQFIRVGNVDLTFEYKPD